MLPLDDLLNFGNAVNNPLSLTNLGKSITLIGQIVTGQICMSCFMVKNVVFTEESRKMMDCSQILLALFLSASSHFYKRSCSSVGWSVGRSVGWSVGW